MQNPTLDEIDDEELKEDVKAIVRAISSLGAKVFVKPTKQSKYQFGCLDYILVGILMILLIGG